MEEFHVGFDNEMVGIMNYC